MKKGYIVVLVPNWLRFLSIMWMAIMLLGVVVLIGEGDYASVIYSLPFFVFMTYLNGWTSKS